jgi:nucleoid-associated protein YgaU
MMFVWGSFSFVGILKSVGADYNLFRRDGTPARAKVTVSMIEHMEEPSGQNPTSGGPAGRRSYTLIEGESLQSLAYAEYGDPNLWRAIAEANRIEDPFAMRPGTKVLLPSRDDAQSYR